MDDRERKMVNVFGFTRSRVEVFIHGIIFLLLQIGYEAFGILQQLPENWTDKDFVEADRPFIIPMILFVISYILLRSAVLGNEEHIEDTKKRFGKFEIFLRQYSLMIAIVLVSLFSPYLILKTFF